jgi:hypothetical protein
VSPKTLLSTSACVLPPPRRVTNTGLSILVFLHLVTWLSAETWSQNARFLSWCHNEARICLIRVIGRDGRVSGHILRNTQL